MLYAIIIISSILGLWLLSRLFSSQNSQTNAQGTPPIFAALKEDGYRMQTTSYCTKFEKKSSDESIEIEFSSPKRNQYKMDVDFYKKSFNIQLPNNISPGFFEHIVFRNFYNKCIEELQIELLPNVANSGYFTRTSIQKDQINTFDFQSLQDILIKHRHLLDNFDFVDQSDLDNDFYKALESEGYVHQLSTQNMLVRYSKIIANCHASVYYIKALDMLFLAISPTSEAAIQEDFRDAFTQLHHFSEKDETTQTSAIAYPSVDTFRQIEFELVEALQQQIIEEE